MKRFSTIALCVCVFFSIFTGCQKAGTVSGTESSNSSNDSAAVSSNIGSDTESSSSSNDSTSVSANTSSNAGKSESQSRVIPSLAASENLKIGVSMTDITPTEAVTLVGGTTGKPSEGVDTRLFIKAMVISDGVETTAIVTIDTLKYMNADMAKRAITKETGIPESNIIITSSHTHSAPFYTYYSNIRKLISSTVKSACDNMEKCIIMSANTEVKGISANRRLLKDGYCFPSWTVSGDKSAYTPAGTADPGLQVFAALRENGTYKAILWNFACHAGANTTNKISADYPGHVQEQLNKTLGYDVPALFLPAACGDVNTSASISVMGSALADGILKSLEKGSYIQHAELHVKSLELQLPSRKNPVLAENDIKTVWPGEIEHYREGFNSFLSSVQPTYPAPICCISIGKDFAIASIPGELFNALGNDIMAKSSFAHTMVAEQSNACLGYMPTMNDFTLGGYETWFAEHSFLEIGAGETLRDSAIDMLKSLAASIK